MQKPQKLFTKATLLIVLGSNLTLQAADWIDATIPMGIEGIPASHLRFAYLDDDHRPDLIIVPKTAENNTPRIYLNRSTEAGAAFIEKTDTGLPVHSKQDVLVFADLNNDGHQDAILGRYLDIYQKTYARPANLPDRSAWFPGKGDGSFDSAIIFDDATLATTRAIAINDVNQDGRLDLFLGNWYERYFSGYEAFDNDLLLQYSDKDQNLRFARWPMPNESVPTDYKEDLGGRPTYGGVLARLDDGLPMILELNYGRRWNRLYQMNTRGPVRPNPDGTPPEPFTLMDPQASAAHVARHLKGKDIAPEVGVDADDIRHGRHQKWPEGLANDKPRSMRPDEPPFRANGNTFDAAVGDIDNDGDFDLFLSTIYHAWAGESSDRSRFLVNQLVESGSLKFKEDVHLSVDRLPADPGPGEEWQLYMVRQNQGDIFAELADLNHDGRLDLILCSSDYPDEPPFEERLRIFLQSDDGSFEDATATLGIDQIGAGMPSIADVDLDGDLDIAVGQSFNRLPKEKRRAAAINSGALSPDSPEDAAPQHRARVFLNTTPEPNSSITLILTGNSEAGINQNALGAVVRMTADIDGDPSTPDVTQIRQLLGPGGHAGKQNEFIIHFGLGKAKSAQSIEITWPNKQASKTLLSNLPAGRHHIDSKYSNL